jgi:hypothetical protein
VYFREREREREREKENTGKRVRDITGESQWMKGGDAG